MVLRHRRRNDERARRIDVRRIMPTHGNPEPREVGSGLRMGIATGYGDAAPEKELGERAHAGTSDTDEVNWSRVV
jgi:hypothetical protein